MSETNYTSPENRGKCGFCNGKEDGYCMPDDSGVVKATCYKCLRKRHPGDGLEQVKRKPVGTTFTEDLDTDEKIAPNPGMKSGRRKRTI